MDRIDLSIDGMSCNHCVRAVTEALSELPGVQVEQVRIGSATVSYDPAAASADDLTRALSDAGYEARAL